MRHRFHCRAVDGVEVELEHSPPRREFRSCLYDALDFSTDRDDGGGQTRESLSRIASPSAAVARLDPARFAQFGARGKSFGFDAVEHSQREDNHKARRAKAFTLRARRAYKFRAHGISQIRAR
jgi:hypothetical protein